MVCPLTRMQELSDYHASSGSVRTHASFSASYTTKVSSATVAALFDLIESDPELVCRLMNGVAAADTPDSVQNSVQNSVLQHEVR
jgi:hypothetical protein